MREIASTSSAACGPGSCAGAYTSTAYAASRSCAASACSVGQCRPPRGRCRSRQAAFSSAITSWRSAPAKSTGSTCTPARPSSSSTPAAPAASVPKPCRNSTRRDAGRVVHRSRRCRSVRRNRAPCPWDRCRCRRSGLRVARTSDNVQVKPPRSCNARRACVIARHAHGRGWRRSASRGGSARAHRRRRCRGRRTGAGATRRSGARHARPRRRA